MRARRVWIFVSVALIVFLSFSAGVLAFHKRINIGLTIDESLNVIDSWIEESAKQRTAAAIASRGVDDSNPYDFYKFKLDEDNQRTYKGYTLIIPQHGRACFLIDMRGNIVHKWQTSYRSLWPHAEEIHILAPYKDVFLTAAHVYPNGDLVGVFASQADTPYGYGVAKIDKDSKPLWKFNQYAHHNLYVDRHNGDVYVLSHDFIHKPIQGAEELYYPMLADSVIRLSADGKTLDQIDILSAFLNSPYALLLYHDVREDGKRWDGMHTNSVMKLEPEIAAKFPMFKAGQLLVSVRNMNAVAVIDPKTRKVVWAYAGLWRGQHSAVFLPNGHILVFDNQGHYEQHQKFSSVIELDPKTLEVAWSFAGRQQQPFYNTYYGWVQRLPNGSTLVSETLGGRTFEVTQDKQIVWQYILSRKNPQPDQDPITTAGVRYGLKDLPFLDEKTAP